MQGSASGDMALALNTLASLSAADARRALDSIAGAGRAASAQVSGFNQRAVNQNIVGRLGQSEAGGSLIPAAGLAAGGVKLAFEESVRSDASPVYAQARGSAHVGGAAFDAAARRGFWLRGFGGTGSLDGDAVNAGSSYRLAGVVAGYDYAFSEAATLGI